MVHLLLPLVIGYEGPATNLLVNGDFEAGAKGFVTAYKASESLFDSGTCAILTDPKKAHEGATSVRDHTGKGAMLAVNGSTEKNVTVWQATVKLMPNKSYTFSGWSTSWSRDPVTNAALDMSPAMLRVYVNGKPTGAVFGVNARSGSWARFTYEWNSGSQTSATIRIVDANIDGVGNDFAIDDLMVIASK